MADNEVRPTSPAAITKEKTLEQELEKIQSKMRNTNTNDNNKTNSISEKTEEARIERSGDDDVPPDGGYGWVCVFCAFWINACTWGQNSSYGVYLAYYLNSDAFPGGTPMLYAVVGGLTVSQGMLISPVGTWMTRVFSSRTTMLVGVFLQISALIAASFSTKIWHLILTQGIVFGWGMGLLFVASVAIIPQWFHKRRSVANGISAAGSGIGGIIFNIITNVMISRLGLPWAFRITAIIAFVVNTTCALLLKDRNHHINPTQRAFDIKILVRWEFFLVMAWGFFSMLGYVGLLFSLPDYAVSVGLTREQASIIGAMLNVGMAFGRPLIGLFSDRFGRINMAGAMTLFTGLTVFLIWVFAKNYGMLIFFAIVNGAVCGVFWTTIAPVCAEVVGMVELPSALSLTWLSLVLPTTFAEVIALQLRTPISSPSSSPSSHSPHAIGASASGRSNYTYMQIYCGAMYMLATLSMYLLRVWKIKDTDRKLLQKRESMARHSGQFNEKAVEGGGSGGNMEVESVPTKFGRGSNSAWLRIARC